MIGRLLLFAALAVTSSYASATGAFKSGNDIFEMCQRRAGGCTYYLLGVIDGSTYAEDFYVGSEKFCLYNVNGEQITDLFNKYLVEHPEERHFSASSLLIGALMTYPDSSVLDKENEGRVRRCCCRSRMPVAGVPARRRAVGL